MRRLFFLGVAILLAFGLSQPADALPITIVDTGPGSGSGDSQLLDRTRYLAGEFSVSTAVTVTGLEGWLLPVYSGTLNVGIYSDAGEVPGSAIFTESVDVTGGATATTGWYGPTSGFSRSLDAGTYWIVFSSPTTGGTVAWMPGSTTSPLAAGAYLSVHLAGPGYWTADDDIDIGVRIVGDDGQPASVPDPGSTLLLLGMSLLGSNALRKRWG